MISELQTYEHLFLAKGLAPRDYFPEGFGTLRFYCTKKFYSLQGYSTQWSITGPD